MSLLIDEVRPITVIVNSNYEYGETKNGSSANKHTIGDDVRAAEVRLSYQQ